ncbi:MAG: glycosyltransferase family 2 protein [Planctomycetaceae bacterium]
MPIDSLLLYFGWGLFLFWIVMILPNAFAMLPRTIVRMTDALPDPAVWPSVSMIIPARDEGPKIEAALRSVLALQYPQLELIAIDDRSQDDTGRIMDRLAAEDPRLHVIHIEQLPEGWLGKNHALHAGAQAARGEYILFTDGDIHFAPDTITRAVKYMEKTRADHLCIPPNMIPGSYMENALIAYFILLFLLGTQPWLIPTRVRFAYAGVGAFNMLRRKSYEAFGGHVPIRLDVLDDVKLGKIVKRNGMRQEILNADDRVMVKWQDSAWHVIRGLEKNGFSTMDYSIPKLLIVSTMTLIITMGPYVGLFLIPSPAAWGYIATLVFLLSIYAILAHKSGSSAWVAPALPVATLGMLFAFWRSAYVTFRQGGVKWRDTFYPLDLLRENIYR